MAPFFTRAPFSHHGKAVELELWSKDKINGKRCQLLVYDATNDTEALASKKVKQCVWGRNAPECIRDTYYSPNQAVLKLQKIVKPEAVQSANMKKHLCMNEQGEAVLLETVLKKGTLKDYMNIA